MFSLVLRDSKLHKIDNLGKETENKSNKVPRDINDDSVDEFTFFLL